jgi:phage replication-related protein YjqB (UPF0714/DUF867 family)
MLADLLATDGVVEHCELRSSIGFMALHGGLEAATFEIAREAALRTGGSLYAVVQPDELNWHVPSHRYAVEESPQLAAFCAHVDVAISLHGFGGLRNTDQRWLTILVGGCGRTHATIVASMLRAQLPEYLVLDDLDAIPTGYRGVHANNPVNKARRGGVQIELPPRVRGSSPIWADHDFDAHPWVPHTEALLAALVSAARALRGGGPDEL